MAGQPIIPPDLRKKTRRPVNSNVHGGCAAMNRGADCVEHLAPALRARTRHSTGHRTPIIQTSFA